MGWIALSFAFIATIFFANEYPGFRRGLGHAILVLIAMAVVTGFIFWLVSLRTESRRQAASKLIKPAQLELLNPTLTLGSSSTLNATILNKSVHELAELEIRVLISDCPSPSGDASISEKEWDEFINGRSKHQASKTVPRTGMFDDLIAKKPIKGPLTAEGMFDDLPDLGRNPSRPDTKAARDGSQCGIVGEYVAEARALRVPKGQKRALKMPIHFSDLPNLAEWSWSYSIDRAFAKYQ